MARLERRAKRVKGKRTKLLEVLSDTKKDRKKKLSTAERDKLRAQRKANIVKPGEVVTKKRKDVVLPTIEAKREKKSFGKTLLSETRKQIEKVTVVAGVKGRVPIGTKAALASTLIPITKIFSKNPLKIIKFLNKNKDKFPFITNKEIIASAAKVGVKLDKSQLGKVRRGLGIARVKGVTDRIVASRFKSNAKSISLTQKLWLGLGLGVSAAFAAKDIYGTYPYAEFIGKEEALQVVGLPIWLAIVAGDLEGAEQLIEEQKEIIASDLGKVPYKNIRNAIEDYVEAQKEAIIEFERLIAKERGEIEFEGTTVGEEIAARDVQKKQEQIDELEFKSEFFRLIDEGRREEAEDLQKLFIEKLKGGN